MATIPLPALHVNPPPQQENPLEQVSRLLQLKSQMQNAPLQSQLLQQQVQEGQQNMAARQALNQAYQGAVVKDANGNPTLDPDKLQQGLAQGPAAFKTPEVMKGIAEFHKSLIDAQTAAQDLQTKQIDTLGNAANAIKAANYSPVLAHSLLDTLPNSPQLQAIRPQIDNPQALKQLVDTAIANSPKQRELSASEATANARTMTAQTEQQKLQASMNPQSSLYAPTEASVAMGTAPGAAQIQAGKQAQAAAVAGADAKARMPYEMSLAAQKQALSQGDPKAAAHLLVSGDATLPELKSRGATPEFISKTLFYANQESGGKYNAPAAEAQFNVAKSQANTGFFGSAGSLVSKGGTLDQLAEAAKDIPQGQIPVFNSIADAEKAATGSGPIAKYASLMLGVSDDYSKVMGGGTGSDSSRAQALHLVPANASPEARAAAIEGIRGAVGSQMESRIGANPTMQRMYGSQLPAKTAGLTVTAPNGKIYSFKSQEEANAFKQKAGIQ